MEKKRYRTDDSVELSLRKFISVINGVGLLLITCVMLIGFGLGVSATMETEKLKPMFMGLLIAAVISVVIWILMKLVTLILTYVTDMHYYSRTSMEVALEAEGIELVDSESWVCPNCGKVHGMDAAFCGSCGTKRPEG